MSAGAFGHAARERWAGGPKLSDIVTDSPTQERGLSAPPLRYLSAAELDRCLPGVPERLDLAAQALSALGRGTAEMPPKIGVHPRPGALLHAMPAWLREGDLVGLKWVSAFPANRELGLPAISGLVVLNDAETGLPTWIMDAARITSVRTAAVSGVGIRLFMPAHAERVAVIGAGVQARAHVEVVAALLPGAELVVYDSTPGRAEALAAEARAGGTPASTVASAEEAAGAADVVITLAPLGALKQVMTPDWLAHGTLAVAVDFATYASAELARDVGNFVVDDRVQFLAYRDAGHFDDYPDPSATMGELLDSGVPPRSARLPALVTHLGVGLADVIFADAIRRRAEAMGAGTELER
jgi:ornithine cyclodeaminase/alanine dehydrogenase-like protein (mu-crystallin family)